MASEIIWTSGAERDLLELHRHLFAVLDEDDAAIARLLEFPLESALRLIADHPHIAPRVRGAPRLRRSVLGPQHRYGLFYAVEHRGIIIHALLDLRQDPERILRRLGNI